MPSLRNLDFFIESVARFGISPDFIRFGLVGAIAFCCDTATVYSLAGFFGLYIAGIFGFLTAASVSWGINRFWTFRHLDHIAVFRQLPQFLLVNSIGFIFNRGTFFILLSVSLLCHNEPVFAIIGGSLAGLFFNYFLTKIFVFNRRDLTLS